MAARERQPVQMIRNGRFVETVHATLDADDDDDVRAVGLTWMRGRYGEGREREFTAAVGSGLGRREVQL